ncbi:MAG: hypothetical protein IJK23_14320 [Clostridia bacterium]|nr:hypothetical protein [Clostridia bacterium]
MKKVLFIVLRAFTALSTLFWAACCVPLVGFCVGMYCDDALGMQTWQFVALICVPPAVGLLTAALFGKQLPKPDLVLSIILPPAFVGGMYGTVSLMDSLVRYGVVVSYVLGAICFAAGIAATVYFVRNGKKIGSRGAS